VALGRPAHAARLLGAADAAKNLTGIRRAAMEPYAAHITAGVKERLEPPVFAAAWDEGCQLSLTDAVAESLTTAAALAAARSVSDAGTAGPNLTPRERDILRLLVEGRSDKEIAAALFIGARTVQTHVGNLFAKLGVNARAEAAAVAVRRGLV
jgi:DNA-binding CsgD family transcriptional regulator